MRQIYYFFADAARIALQSIFAQKLARIPDADRHHYRRGFRGRRGRFDQWIQQLHRAARSAKILGVNHFMIARFAHQGEWTEEEWDRAWKRNKTAALRRL